MADTTLRNKSIALNFTAIDIGNSRIKIKSSARSLTLEYEKNWERKVKSFLHQYSNDVLLIGYSSVNPGKLNILLPILKQMNVIAFDIKRMAEKQYFLEYRHIKGIGIDRVLGMLGAMSFINPPFITVDCGTAITINAVNKNSKCLGGTIMPGITTQMKSLAEKTSALPKVEIKSIKKTVGKETANAIRSGVLTGTKGAIKEIINKIEKEEFASKKVPIILTGGESVYVFRELKKQRSKTYPKKDLVLDGILWLMKNYNF
ncbi:MAG: type III pantothenate kinase [Ignavibacteriae bacterium]|nr:type III pantothenate kinase [Ignavibacteriota bacterium]